MSVLSNLNSAVALYDTLYHSITYSFWKSQIISYDDQINIELVQQSCNQILPNFFISISKLTPIDDRSEI